MASLRINVIPHSFGSKPWFIRASEVEEAIKYERNPEVIAVWRKMLEHGRVVIG